jgi:3-oxoacyl-[acyl-carrier-protein] synthase-3
VGVELISRWVNWKDRNTCILFGDGAGAVVMEATHQPSGVLSFVLGSDGAKGDRLILPGGGSVHPPSQQMLAEGLHYLFMDGREVFKFATRVLGKAVRQAIKEAGITPDDIDLFIPHQANQRIIDSASRQARLPKEKVYINIHKYGNTSAASIPIALCEAFEDGSAQVGDTFVFVSFGAGLTWASAVVKIAERDIQVEPRRFRVPLLDWISRIFRRDK